MDVERSVGKAGDNAGVRVWKSGYTGAHTHSSVSQLYESPRSTVIFATRLYLGPPDATELEQHPG